MVDHDRLMLQVISDASITYRNLSTTCLFGRTLVARATESGSVSLLRTLRQIRYDDGLFVLRLHDTTGCTTGLTTVMNEQPLFVQLG